MLSTIRSFKQSSYNYQKAIKTGETTEIKKAQKSFKLSLELLKREDEMLEDIINVANHSKKIIRKYEYKFNPSTRKMERILIENQIRTVDLDI